MFTFIIKFIPDTYDHQNSFNNFTISPKVYKQIILNGPILVNNGMDVSIRAADFIELNDGFEVATDGVFFADVIGGCDEGYLIYISHFLSASAFFLQARVWIKVFHSFRWTLYPRRG